MKVNSLFITLVPQLFPVPWKSTDGMREEVTFLHCAVCCVGVFTMMINNLLLY